MSQDTTSKTLDLNVKPVRASQINRVLVISVLGGFAVIVLVIILLALEPKTPVHSPATLQTSAAATTKKGEPFGALPSNYAESTRIQAILNRDASTALPKEVKETIDRLKATQKKLETELASVRAKQSAVPASSPSYSSEDRQAIVSPLFFPGGAPVPAPKPKVDTDQSKTTKKTTTDQMKGSTAATSGFGQQNMQADKINFFDAKPSKDIYNKAQVQFPASKYIIQAGEVIPSVLQSEIISDNPGMIVAIVNQNVYDNLTGRYLMIPKGSKLIGKYFSKLSFHQSSLQATFSRLIRPDGSSIVLQSMPGVNGLGVSGFADTVDNHWGLIVGSAVLSAVFNIPAIVATSQADVSSYDANGNYRPAPLASQARSGALQSVGQSASQVGNKLASQSLNLQPSVTIHAGYKFAIIVNKDLVLPPYKEPFSGQGG